MDQSNPHGNGNLNPRPTVCRLKLHQIKNGPKNHHRNKDEKTIQSRLQINHLQRSHHQRSHHRKSQVL
jgi:hypothetical protein